MFGGITYFDMYSTYSTCIYFLVSVNVQLCE